MILSYDLASRLTGITRGNGVNTVMQRAANGRLTALTHASSAGMLAQINLTRDPLGRITKSTIDSDVLPGPNFIRPKRGLKPPPFRRVAFC